MSSFSDLLGSRHKKRGDFDLFTLQIQTCSKLGEVVVGFMLEMKIKVLKIVKKSLGFS